MNKLDYRIHEHDLKKMGQLIPLKDVGEWENEDEIYYQIHLNSGKNTHRIPYFKKAKYNVMKKYIECYTLNMLIYHNFVKLIKE